MKLLSIFKKKIEPEEPKPEYKYKLNINIITIHGPIIYSINIKTLNPFDLIFYRRLWRWYFLRTSPLYILRGVSENNLPTALTVRRSDIIQLKTSYTKNK